MVLFLSYSSYLLLVYRKINWILFTDFELSFMLSLTEQWAPFLPELPKSWHWIIWILNFSDSPGPPRRDTTTDEQLGLSFLRCAHTASRGRSNLLFLAGVERLRGRSACVVGTLAWSERMRGPSAMSAPSPRRGRREVSFLRTKEAPSHLQDNLLPHP